MGTRIELFCPQGVLPGALDTVRGLFTAWDLTLSRFREDSDLSRLNRSDGRAYRASKLLFRVLSEALRYARETDGSFDPTLLAQIEGLGYKSSFERIEAGEEVPSLAGAISSGGGWRGIRLEHVTGLITLPSGVGVDLGGIAKGMVVDAAVALLRERGIDAALVSAGGDLRVLGLPPDQDAWPIGLEDVPHSPAVPLREGALATSGTTRRRWRQDGVMRHHLLDPASGYPVESGLRTVTVAAGSCVAADVAAKTAFVRGPEAGKRYLVTHGLAGLLVFSDGRLEPVGPWPATFEGGV